MAGADPWPPDPAQVSAAGVLPGAGRVPASQHASPAGWDPGEAEERKVAFHSLEDFVAGYFAPLMSRRLGGHLTWCAEWWRHEEGITRLTVIWDTWEFYRYEGATGLSEWLLHHADPHLAVLMSKDNGPFMSCKPERHAAMPPLPCDPPLPGWLDHPAYREPEGPPKDSGDDGTA